MHTFEFSGSKLKYVEIGKQLSFACSESHRLRYPLPGFGMVGHDTGGRLERHLGQADWILDISQGWKLQRSSSRPGVDSLATLVNSKIQYPAHLAEERQTVYFN